MSDTANRRLADDRSAQTFEQFFQARTRESLCAVLTVIAGLHAFAAAAYWLTAPYEQAYGLAAFSVLVAVTASSGAVLAARSEHTLLKPNGVATCVILLALCNAQFHLVMAWSPLAVAGAAILVVICGLVFSSRKPLFLVLGAMQAWWALLAWADNWSPAWLQFGAALLGATVAAHGMHFMRRNAARQLYDIEQRFVRQSQRDPLTNLPLLTAMVDRIGEHLARGKRNSERKFGLCVLNVDGFHKINDELGYAKGDLVLQTIAERLRLACRRTDMVARLGGDEFVLLLDETPTAAHAEAGADRLCAMCCTGIDLDGLTVNVGVSFGVAFSGADFEHAEAMILAARREMQDSKARAHAVARAVEAHKDVRAQAGRALPSPA